MPLLHICTNIEIDNLEHFTAEASCITAQMLGKPESYVMVKIEDKVGLIFAGNNEPAAHILLKSLGLPESETTSMSATLCSFVKKTLNIKPGRIYIEFSSPQRHMWGWDNKTF